MIRRHANYIQAKRIRVATDFHECCVVGRDVFGIVKYLRYYIVRLSIVVTTSLRYSMFLRLPSVGRRYFIAECAYASTGALDLRRNTCHMDQ